MPGETPARSGPRDREEESVERYLADPTQERRNDVIAAHRWVAEEVARRFSRRTGVSHEDLRQVALLALLRTVERFDPDGGASFATFARRSIEGECKHFLRDATWTVRPGRKGHDAYESVQHSIDAATQDLGHSPTVEDLARFTGLDVEDVRLGLEVGVIRTTSAWEPLLEGGARSGSASSPTPADPRTGWFPFRGRLKDVIRGLEEPDREMVFLRFFGGWSQQELADRYGLSQSAVSRRMKAVLEQMREELEGHPPTAD